MYQQQHLLVCISLIYPYLTYSCTLWRNNYNAQNLQNKALHVINDVPLMVPITPHYLSLHLLKFPNIVKLNTCISSFMIISTMKRFPNIPVSLVSELHNYSYTCGASSNQIFIVLCSFQTNLRRFFPSSIKWNNTLQFIRDKPYQIIFRILSGTTTKKILLVFFGFQNYVN